MAATKSSAQGKWLATNPSKRWFEVFILCYSPSWMIWLLCIIVPFKIYDHMGKLGYLLAGIASGVPCLVLPMLLDRPADKGKPLTQQYWLLANVWIAIMSFIGNYLWTHYFYVLLGAAYTFPSWELNKVPFALYLITHAYFCFYHVLSNIVIRRTKYAMRGSAVWKERLAIGVSVFVLAYVTALMETVTIAHFPYYTHKDKGRMYTIGSLFYAIYFFVSFPMFFRIGEESRVKWTISQAALDSFAACMIVTMLLDFWRLGIGAITDVDYGIKPELPWMQ